MTAIKSRIIWRRSHLFTIALIMIAACQAQPLPTPADQNLSEAGTKFENYEITSPRCTTGAGNGACEKTFSDCLSIRRSGDKAIVKLYSVQANQSICSFSYKMKMTPDGSFRYSDENGQLSIERTPIGFVISGQDFDSSVSGAGVCGAHADIDQLIFPLKAMKLSTTDCPSPND